MAEVTEKHQVGWLGLALRLFFFALFELIGLLFFATVFDELFGRLAAGALGTFAAAAIANARLNSVEEFNDHPSLTGRDRWRNVAVPGGQASSLLPPAGLGGVQPRMDPVPALGEHTEDILGRIGYQAPEIARLRAEGTI